MLIGSGLPDGNNGRDKSWSPERSNDHKVESTVDDNNSNECNNETDNSAHDEENNEVISKNSHDEKLTNGNAEVPIVEVGVLSNVESHDDCQVL